MPKSSSKKSATAAPLLDDLVFVGFNSRVVALDRFDGRVIWTWKSPAGSGYVAIAMDGDRLIVSVNGYTYCLDPLFGQVVWRNELPGMGVGIASVVTVRAASGPAGGAAAMQQQAAAAAAAG